MKEFSQGNSPADVLEELGKNHKFTVTFATEAVRAEAEAGKLYGNVAGVSAKQFVAAISHLAAADGLLPWTAEKSALTFLDPQNVVTVVHDVRLLGPLMTDRDQFLQAVRNSVDGVWDVDETNACAESGSILEVTSTAMTVRQSNRSQARMHELLVLLKQEVNQGAATNLKAPEKKLLGALEKRTALAPTELPVLEAFGKLLTENHVPWLLVVPADSSLDLESIMKIAEGKHRIIDVVEMAAIELDLTVDLIDGILVMAVRDEEFSRVRPRVYNIQRLLGNSTPEDIADEIMSLDNVSTEWTEILGPLLIIQTDFDSHRRIQAAISAEPERPELEEQIVQVTTRPEQKSRQGNGDSGPTLRHTPSGTSVKLLSPTKGAELSNGDFTKTKEHEWTFDWADVPHATKYHLVVQGATATIAVIDRNDIPKSEWKYVSQGYVIDRNRRNWTWKVRAFVNGQWTEWSDTRTFDVKALVR